MQRNLFLISLMMLGLFGYCSIYLLHALEQAELTEKPQTLMQKLVGSWKGVAQPKRGSNIGSWGETAEWVWEFNPQKEPVGLRFTVDGNKYLKSALLTFNDKTGEFKLLQDLEDKTTREYTGKAVENALFLETAAKESELGYKIKITPLSDVRLLVLYEQKLADRVDYGRLVEVGYTRKGVKLAQEGGGGPICIVTGGEGTSSVSYHGKTYYVCCSGCKQAFEDNPEKFIQQAAEKAAQKAVKPQ